jgi:hypothetical protein
MSDSDDYIMHGGYDDILSGAVGTLGNITVSGTAPAYSSTGSVWFDSTTNNTNLNTGVGNVTIPTGTIGGTYYTTTTGGTQWANFTPNTAHFDSSLVINHKGQRINVGESLSMIMDRLCIIEPSLHLHAKYPALKEAYDAYRAIEAMCKAGDKEDE